MTVGNANSRADMATLAIFDAAQATQILSEADIAWPTAHEPTDVRIERGWPERNGEFAAEWSFSLENRRYSIHASTRLSAESEPVATKSHPVVTPAGLRSLDVHLSDSSVYLHTPDCDAAMPHMARCLDPVLAPSALAPYWTTALRGRDGTVEQDLLAYRAGKRAAIAYRRSDGARLLGKTFRGDRAERLMVRHVDLATRLRHFANNGVALRVAAPLGFIPSLNMALFEWCDNDVSSTMRADTDETATLAADALATLHSLEAHSTDEFTRADEGTVIRRWHDTLRGVAPSLADVSAPLVEALVTLADDGEDTDVCTVHRDFYEKQFLYHDGIITLLDLDTLATGSPCIDLGNLLAHLRLTNAAAGHGLDAFLDLAAAVVQRYARRRGTIDRSALAFYWASAAFRVGAVHALRTATRTHTPELWSLAEALLRHQGVAAAPETGRTCRQPDFASIFEWTES